MPHSQGYVKCFGKAARYNLLLIWCAFDGLPIYRYIYVRRFGTSDTFGFIYTPKALNKTKQKKNKIEKARFSPHLINFWVVQILIFNFNFCWNYHYTHTHTRITSKKCAIQVDFKAKHKGHVIHVAAARGNESESNYTRGQQRQTVLWKISDFRRVLQGADKAVACVRATQRV